MSAFLADELNWLPELDVIEPLDFESILSEIHAFIIGKKPELEQSLKLESESLNVITQAMAYRETVLRAHANNLAKSIMLPLAKGPQLDQLGALPFIKLLRKNDENDDNFKVRLHMALEGISTAGPMGAYISRAMAAADSIIDVDADAPTFVRWAIPDSIQSQLPDNAMVLVTEQDIGLTAPMPGDVAITILTKPGTESIDDVIDNVNGALTPEDDRPINDRPRVRHANIKEFTIQARLWFYPGKTDAASVETAKQAIQAYTQKHYRLGHDITLSGINAALTVEGIQRVELVQPTQSIAIDKYSAAYCTGVQLEFVGEAE